MDRRFVVSRIPIIDFILSLISTWWAIVLILNPNLFSEYPQQYSAFSKLLPEYGWMIMFVVAASVKIIGIFMQFKLLRKIGLVMSAIIYSFIVYCFINSTGGQSTGIGTYFAMATMALWGIREVERTHG